MHAEAHQKSIAVESIRNKNHSKENWVQFQLGESKNHSNEKRIPVVRPWRMLVGRPTGMAIWGYRSAVHYAKLQGIGVPGLGIIRVVGPTSDTLPSLGCVVDPTAADGVPRAHTPTKREDGNESGGGNPQKSSVETPGATSTVAVPTAGRSAWIWVAMTSSSCCRSVDHCPLP